MTIARRFYVAGRVQGVFFRASAQQEARRLGLSGWAKNLSDGRVEVLAIGAEELVDTMAEWLQLGPRLARVDSLTTEVVDLSTLQGVDDFSCG
jgi:acylphosphatase